MPPRWKVAILTIIPKINGLSTTSHDGRTTTLNKWSLWIQHFVAFHSCPNMKEICLFHYFWCLCCSRIWQWLCGLFLWNTVCILGSSCNWAQCSLIELSQSFHWELLSNYTQATVRSTLLCTVPLFTLHTVDSKSKETPGKVPYSNTAVIILFQLL